MSKRALSEAVSPDAERFESGLEALQSNPDFRGPVEPLGDRDGDDDRDPERATDHAALVYESRAEQFAAAIPFVRRGLERNERCLYVAHETTREEVVAAMRAGGIDVDAALESGRLSIRDADETFRRNGRFDADETIAYLEDAVDAATAEYEALRVTGEMSGALRNEGDAEELAAFEAAASALFDGVDARALCQYDRTQVPADVVRDVIDAHPLLVHDGRVSRNVYYTPPAAESGSEPASREVDRLLGSLREQTDAKAELRRRERFLRDSYRITADPALEFETKLERLLELGRERFGVELGGMAAVDRDADRIAVEHVSGDHESYEPGLEFPLSETFCGAAVETGDVLGIVDPAADGYDDRRVCSEHGFETYLGTVLEIEGDRDRMVFFMSGASRDRPFSTADRTFIDLIGQWLTYELEHRQRERELRERTHHLRALVETTPECIKTVAADGTLLQMNSAGLEMVEADAESDVVGECVYDLIAPEDRRRFREFNERICEGDGEGGDDGGSLEFDIVGLGGTRRHMETHAAPLRRPDGTTAQVALTRDVTERVEREAELRQTKTRFETVFEQSDDGIFIVDPEADELVDANPAACELTGYSRDELRSSRPSERHVDEREQFRAFLDAVRENGSAWTEDLHVHTKDGRDVPVEVSASATTLDDRSLVLGNVRPIEARKTHERYQRELHEIIADSGASFETKIEGLLELGSDRFGLEIGYFTRTDDHDTFDIVRAVGDHERIRSGVTDSLCDTYCEKLLASPGTIAVTDAAEVGWTDDPAYERFGLDAYFATTVHVGGEEYGTLCFGADRPRDRPYTDAERTFLDLMGQWVEYELERQRRERFLRENSRITSDPSLAFEAKLERLLDLGREWMGLDAAGLTHLPSCEDEFRNEYTVGYGGEAADGFRTDPGDGCYCRAAIAADEPVGMADVRGTDWEDDEIHREHGLTCYLGTKVTNGTAPYGTLWVGSAEPRDREFTETERTFLELMGQWVSYEIEREHRERALEASNERLEQFAYAASHDLQEPLRMVTSYLQLLENRYADAFDADGEEFLAFAVDGADRMREMIDGLLEYSRIETRGDPFEPVDLDRALEDVLADLQLQIDEADAEISVGDLPRVAGDASQLRQVFQNLLENAITYSESSPRVRIDAKRRREEWVISVSDDGIGIDPEDQDRIFTVFDRLHSREAYDGTGLGLALCQRIVERHGGDIWVESEPGEGSTFSVSLPVDEA